MADEADIKTEMVNAMKATLEKGVETDAVRQQEKGREEEVVPEAAAPEAAEAKETAEAPAETPPAPEKAAEEPPKAEAQDELPERSWQSLVARNKENLELKRKVKELEAGAGEGKELRKEIDQLKEVKSFVETWHKDPIAYLDRLLGDDGLRAWQERVKARQAGDGATQPARVDPEVRKLRQKIEELEKNQHESKREVEERESQRMISEYVANVERAAKGLGEKQFKVFQRLNGSAVAMQIASTQAQAGGGIMDPEEAAKAAHAQILKELREQAEEAGELIGFVPAPPKPTNGKKPPAPRKDKPEAEERKEPLSPLQEAEETRRKMAEAMRAAISSA